MIDLPLPPRAGAPRLGGRLAPRLALAAFALLAAGLGDGLLFGQGGAARGDANRILLLHCPASWLALAAYAFVCGAAAITLARPGPGMHAARLARAVAPTGFMLTALALWTGAMWSKPVQGLWWSGDAHAVAGGVLLALFGAVIAVRAVVAEDRAADRAAALVALVGGANLLLLVVVMQGARPARAVPSAADAASALLDAAPVPVALDLALITAGLAAYVAFVVLLRLRLEHAP